MSVQITEYLPILEVEGWSFHFPKEKTHASYDEMLMKFNMIWPTGASLYEDERGVYILTLEYYADEVKRVLDAWYELFMYLNDVADVWKTYPGKLVLHYVDSEGNLQTFEETRPSADMEEAVARIIDEVGLTKFEEAPRCVICGNPATEYVGNEPMCRDCAEEYRHSLQYIGLKPYEVVSHVPSRMRREM